MITLEGAASKTLPPTGGLGPRAVAGPRKLHIWFRGDAEAKLPVMEVRVWQSFSCNNSGNFYLVARFASPELAHKSAAEIRAFLATHARQKDELADADDWEAPSAVQQEVATKYGFSWGDEMLHWGDDALEGDEPCVGATDDSVVVYHSYCGGLGFLEPLARALGGTEVESVDGAPTLSVMLTFANDSEGAAARDALAAFFGQGATVRDVSAWDATLFGGALPEGRIEEMAHWILANHAGFHFETDASIIDGVRSYLDGPGVIDYQMTIDAQSTREKLEVLVATKRCPECKSRDIEFVPASDDEHDDQMSCAGCGGMFDLPTLELLSPFRRLDTDTLYRAARTKSGLVAVSGRGDFFVRIEQQWTKRSSGLGALRAVHARTMGDLWICGEYGNLRSSRDGGKNWKQHKLETSACLYSIHETDDALFVSGDNGTLLRSKNGGGSWEKLTIPRCGDALHVTSSPQGVLWVATRRGELAVSSDGAKWAIHQLNNDGGLCRIVAGNERVVVVGDAGAVFVGDSSENASFERVDGGSSGDFPHLVYSGSHGYVAIDSAGAVITSDDGSSWTVHAGAVPRSMWGLVDDHDGALVAVGANGAVARIELD